MGREESQPEAPAFCHRIINLLMDNFIVRGLKHVTLGHPLTDHALTQGPVSGSPQNGVDSIEDNYFDAIKHTEEEEEENMQAHRKPKNDADLLDEVEFDQDKGFDDLAPIEALGSSIHASKEGGSQTLVQNDIQSIPPWIVPDQKLEHKHNHSRRIMITEVGNNKLVNSLSQSRDQNDPQLPLEQVKVQDRSSQKEVVVPNATTFQARGLKKMVTIKDGKKKRETKEKRKSVSWKEKLTMAIEPEKDVNVKSPRPVRPSIRVAFNIDEQSDELIRRTREALRNSSDVEPVTP